jgi:hypothetical protein
MTFYNAAGSRLTKSQLLALTQTPASADPPLQFTAPVYQSYSPDGGNAAGGTFEDLNRLAYATGQIVPTSVINGDFVAATIASISPATGPAAGGTAVTIKGTDFGGTAGVTFGGTAATSVKVIDSKTITCVTPAKSAATVNVVVQDDSGDVTSTGGFVFV